MSTTDFITETRTRDEVAAEYASITLADVTVDLYDGRATGYIAGHRVVEVAYTISDPMEDLLSDIEWEDKGVRLAVEAWATDTKEARDRNYSKLMDALEETYADDVSGAVIMARLGLLHDGAERTAAVGFVQFADEDHSYHAARAYDADGINIVDFTIRDEYLGEDGETHEDWFPIGDGSFNSDDVAEAVLLEIQIAEDAELAVDSEYRENDNRRIERYVHGDVVSLDTGIMGRVISSPYATTESWQRLVGVATRKHEEAVRKTREARDKAIRTAVSRNAPKAAVARVAGLSRQQVYEIIGK